MVRKLDMYEIHSNKQFRSAYKKLVKSGRFKREEFNKIIDLLEKGEALPPEYHDHILRGNLSESRECHIAGDTLLIYEVDLINKMVRLTGIGNHAQLFE